MIEASAAVASAWAGRQRTGLMKSAARWIARIRNEYRIRRGIDELMALDDRLLSDIGLSRGDVEYAARYGRHFRTTKGRRHR